MAIVVCLTNQQDYSIIESLLTNTHNPTVLCVCVCVCGAGTRRSPQEENQCGGNSRVQFNTPIILYSCNFEVTIETILE